MTSNDVVRIVKRCVRPSKVGHSGTLDPAATGLMVVLIGAATRTLDYLDESRKYYNLVVLLGEETDSGDREGNVISSCDTSALDLPHIEGVVERYVGVMDQVPPHFSAIKKRGVPMYKLARKGIFPELAARKIEIFSLTVVKWEPPFLELELICSKGAYAAPWLGAWAETWALAEDWSDSEEHPAAPFKSGMRSASIKCSGGSTSCKRTTHPNRYRFGPHSGIADPSGRSEAFDAGISVSFPSTAYQQNWTRRD